MSEAAIVVIPVIVISIAALVINLFILREILKK